LDQGLYALMGLFSGRLRFTLARSAIIAAGSDTSAWILHGSRLAPPMRIQHLLFAGQSRGLRELHLRSARSCAGLWFFTWPKTIRDNDETTQDKGRPSALLQP